MNLTDPTGKLPNCQNDCVPTDEGYWEGKARISCLDIKTHGGTTESYLRWEANSAPVALLTRVAMAENNTDHGDRKNIMWVIKLRMEIAFSNGGATKGDTTTLEQEVFARNQFSSVTGYLHSNGTYDYGMIDVKDPKGEAEQGNITSAKCGNALNAAIYPCDVGTNPDDANANALKNWRLTYGWAQHILYASLDKFKVEFPRVLRDISADSFGAGSRYYSQTTHDDEWIWNNLQ